MRVRSVFYLLKATLLALALLSGISAVFAESTGSAAPTAPVEPVRIAIGPILPPLLERDTAGHLQGFAVDFLSEAARRANLTIEFVVVPDLRSLYTLDRRSTPLAAWLLSEESIHGYHRFERAYLSLHSAVFRRNARGAQSEIDALDLGEIATLEGSEAHRDLLDEGAVKVFPYPSIEDAVRAVAAGQHDTLFANEMVVLDAIQRLHATNVVEVPSPEMHMHQRFAIYGTDGSRDLEAKLTPILRAMRHDGGFDSLYRKWFDPLTPPEENHRLSTVTAVGVASLGLVLALVLFVSRKRLLEKLKGQTRAINESETQLAAIMSASPTGIFRLDAEGRVTFGNQEAARITGIESGPITHRRWLEAIHPEDRDAVKRAWMAAQRNGTPDHREYRFVHPNGDIVWVLDRGQPELDSGGKRIGFIGTLTDITQLKRNEEKLRADAHIFENMSEGVNTVDVNRTLLYVNAAFEKMFGYDSGELIGKNSSILSDFNPAEYERTREEIRSALVERGSWSGEFRNRRKDGSVFWAHARISLVEGDGPAYAVCVQEDVTETRRAEEALRQSEERFRRVAETALVGIGIHDSTRYTYVNDALSRLLDSRPEDFAGKTWQEQIAMTIAPEDRPRVSELFARMDASGSQETEALEDVQLIHRDGSPRWATLFVGRLYPDRKYPRLTMSVDTTARVLAKQALRQSEERFRAVAESALIGISIFDGEKYTYANQAMFRLMPHDPDEFNAWSAAERIERTYAPEDRERLTQALATMAQNPRNFKSLQINDIQMKRKEGGYRWVNAYWTQLVPGQGYPMMAMTVDVTERKHAELALREREEKLRRTEQLARVGGWEINVDLGAGSWSDETRSIHEVPDDFQPTLESGLAFFSPADRERLMAAARDAIEKGTPWHFEGDLTTARGRKIWVRTTGEPVYENGRVVRLVGAIQDITEIKRAQESLRESEQRLRAIIESEPECVKLLDQRGILLDMNPAGLRMVGAESAAEVVGRDTCELIMPQYKDVFRAGIQEVFAGKSTQQDFEIVGLDGAQRWVEQHAVPLWDVANPGRVKEMLAVTRDVTARKQAEAALRQSESRLALIFNSNSDLQVLFRVDAPGRYVVEAVNRAYTEYLGRLFPDATKRLIGRERGDFLLELGFPMVEAVAELSHYNHVVDAKTTVSYEIPFAVQGREAVLEVSLEPVVDSLGCCTHVLWNARNVTDRRRAEAALRESEEKFRRVAENALVGICLHDGNRFTFVNDAMRRIVGWPQEAGLDALERKDLATLLVTEADAHRVLSAMRALDKQREAVAPIALEDVCLRHADGSPRWTYIMVSRLFTDRQFPRVTLCVDTTERKLAEEGLRRSRDMLTRTQELAKVGGWEFDAVSYEFVCSDELRVIFEVAPDDAVTYNTLLSFFPADQQAVIREHGSRTIADGAMFTFESAALTASGSDIWVRVSAEPVRVDGRVVRLVGAVQDITEQHKAEAERRELERAMLQAQKLESLGVLTGGIAHDFNNLLAGILGNADLALQDTEAGGPVHESVSQIAVAAQRAADLVNQMLAYSGRSTFVVRDVQLGEMVREMTKLLQVTLSKKAVLRFELDAHAPPVQADHAQIQQVVMNLITNASDALGDKPGVITLRSGVKDYTRESLRAYAPNEPTMAGRYVFLEVSDTGCGMDEQTLARIFDPFFTTKFTGRGLGLAATLGIVRGHHGGLRVTSRVGDGTTFRIIFPAVRAESAQTNGHTKDTSAAQTGRATLLVVDDDPRVRDFMARALRLFGHEVFTAADGAEALVLAERHGTSIQAVLLDLTMPGISGDDVLRELHQKYPGLPIVLMSGYSGDGLETRFPSNGYSAFLRKPFSLDTLRATVESVLAPKQSFNS